MAQAKGDIGNKGIKRHLKKKNQKKTSIGCSENTRQNNKNKKRVKGSAYRGQGK